MAERRMFAKTIVGSARFLKMPATSRLLYYDLGMDADDDGCVEAFSVMRKTGANDDDLRVLVSKGFVRILNEDLVSHILDWNVNNQIRKDRYHEGAYKGLLTESCDVVLLDGNQVATKWQPSGNQVATEIRLGKDSIGKDRLEIGEDREGEESPDDERPVPSTYAPYEQIKNLYNETCKSLSKCTAMSEARKKCIKARLSSGYTMEHFKQLFEKAEASSFMKGANSRNWRATFDWLIKDGNMAKVLDGNYDDHVEIPAPAKSGYQQPQQQASRTFRDILREAEEKQ